MGQIHKQRGPDGRFLPADPSTPSSSRIGAMRKRASLVRDDAKGKRVANSPSLAGGVRGGGVTLGETSTVSASPDQKRPVALPPSCPPPQGGRKKGSAPRDDGKENAFTPRATRKHIRGVLTALLCDAHSGPTQISAAKVLLELMDKQDALNHEAKRNEKDERDALTAEVRGLLATLAAAKSARAQRSPQVAQGGKA